MTLPDDQGPATIDHIFRMMRVDAEWSVRTSRSFTWWMGRFEQEVLAEPAFWSNDHFVSRLVARTTVAVDVPKTETTVAALASLNATEATTSALVLQDDGTLLLVSTALTHAVIAEWMRNEFGVRTAMQAAFAELQADALIEILGGRLATSHHPTSGPRAEVDEMVDVHALMVTPDGQQASRFIGAEMKNALALLTRLGARTTGDDRFVAAFLPYRDAACLLQLAASEAHPSLGNGLRAILRLPVVPFGASAPACAATLNLMEMRGPSQYSLLHGAWCVSDDGEVAFNCFFPNISGRPSGLAENVVLWLLGKAKWVASLGDHHTAH